MISCVLTMLISACSTRLIEESIQCLPHGVLVNSTPGYGLQICSPIECLVIPPEENSGAISISFPPSLSANPFEVFVKMVTEQSTFVSKRSCPASDVCYNMRDDWSLDHLTNPHCYPWTTFVILGLILYGILTITASVAYMVCYKKVTGAELTRNLWDCHCFFFRGLMAILFFLPWLLTAPFRGVCAWLRRGARARRDGRRRGETRTAWIRRESRALLGLMILTIISLNVTSGCNHAIITSEEVLKCKDKECNAERGVEISMDTLSRSGCIEFLNGITSEVEGSITLEVMANELTCVKRTEGLHRECETHVASSKRCFGMGSCNGTVCEGMTKNDELAEFDHIHQFPGHSYCYESCGGWECGCLSFHSGCLFYKTYLVPTSTKIYESMRCTTWINRVTLRVNVTTGGISNSTTLTLREGEFSHKMEGEGINLIRMEEIEQPAYSDILTHAFLTDGERMAAIRNFKANNVCPDEESAKSFKCRATEQCTCQPATVKAKCDCDSSTLEEQLTLIDTLPIRFPSMDVLMNSETLSPLIHLHRGNVKVYIVLSEEIQKTRVHEDEIRCAISTKPLTNCYQCAQGAKAEFDCVSDQRTEAIVSCDGNTFNIPCDSPSIKSERRLHFDRSDVEVTCQSTCDKREIILKGKLSTPPHLSPSTTMMRIKGGEVPRGEIMPDLGPIIEFINDHWKTSLIIGSLALLTSLSTVAIATIGPTIICASMASGFRKLWPIKGRYKTV